MRKAGMAWGWRDVVLLVLALVPVVLAGWFWDQLPQRMAVHFGINGQPDGFQDKRWFLATMAALLIGLPVLFKVIPRIDPKRENYGKFEDIYTLFLLALTAFLSVVFGVTIFYNLGYPVHIQQIALSGVGVLFLLMGNFLGRIRFNYFFGIRTPWTLADEQVWRKTHRMAGPVWMAAGVVALISAFLPGEAAVWVFFAGVIAAGLVPVAYSYWLYRNMERG
ncbi:MAG: SdpI family protein [Alicyclobacillaceae bacterium]|nr:SdpI family protein [Alicyclobacillaceae bacterium]